MDTTIARAKLTSIIRPVEQGCGRIILTTYGEPRAGLVSLQDVALLRILDLQPDLMAQVKAHLPS